TFSVLVYAEGFTIGANLEFVDGDFSGEAFDGGFGLQVGYEFKEQGNWQYGVLFEGLSLWNDEEDLYNAGEMVYDSRSLFATARPTNWPVIFKAGIVDAEYKVLLQNDTQNFREVNDTGYAVGIGLVMGNETFRVNLLDIQHIKVGGETFTSYGITLAIFAH
ncbi:MAG: hypothetical protein P8Y24_01615, partial [Gammaproteobacteria bacterium]